MADPGYGPPAGPGQRQLPPAQPGIHVPHVVHVGKYFDAAGRRGEISELKEELGHTNKEKKKEALKKIIQAMTNGADVVSLFPDVVNCMQTNSLDLKKLVYLYVINYAKSQPDLAILAIHSFRKDASDPNPLLRALAVRTMGCIRLEQMTEYLLEPLRRSCRDQDAYVRKTATLCIAKLFDINSELIEDQGFIDILRDMLGDANPMVVSNAVASLMEISSAARRNYLALDEDSVSKLMKALQECTEWGQVFILDALATYDPPTPRAAEAILDHGVAARLAHQNSAVVLSAVKVIMKYMDRMQNMDRKREFCRKMTGPLVTLLSAESEIQYVVMRNINLIVQKQPAVCQQDVRLFVCKYNDPLYVKFEKIAVMTQLASERNVDQILAEFVEYASEVDIDVVRRSVRAIGQCAIKLDRAAEMCVQRLLELVRTGVNYVVQEAVVVIKDIFRKYPGRYESIIGDLCENLRCLDEPEAKSSMIWIMGEYCDRISNSQEVLQTFLESFHEEPARVQLQLLTATVKLCLKVPQSSRELVSRVLRGATEESNNPDLRDRAYMYVRLLSSNPQLAKQVVLSERPTISDNYFACQPRLLDRLIANISTLASVYHQLPETFVLRSRHEAVAREDDNTEDEAENEEKINAVRAEMRSRVRQGNSYVEDDEDASDSEEEGSSDDEMSSTPPPPLRQMVIALSEQQRGQNDRSGIRVGGLVLCGPRGAIGLKLTVCNFTPQPVGQFDVSINKNSFGLGVGGPLSLPESIPPNGGVANTVLVLSANQPQMLSGQPPSNPLFLQVALRCSTDVFFFNVGFDLSNVLAANGLVSQESFRETWQQVPPDRKTRCLGQIAAKVSPQDVVGRCRQYFLHLVAQREGDDADLLYFSARTCNGLSIYCEVSLQRSAQGVQLVVCSQAPPLVPVFQVFVGELLRVRWQGD